MHWKLIQMLDSLVRKLKISFRKKYELNQMFFTIFNSLSEIIGMAALFSAALCFNRMLKTVPELCCFTAKKKVWL